MGKRRARFKKEPIKSAIKHKKPDRPFYPNYQPNCVRCDNYDHGIAIKGIKLCSTCAGDWICDCKLRQRRMGIEVVCNDCGALKPITKLCPQCRFYDPTRIPEYFDCCWETSCIDKAKEELKYYNRSESEIKIYDPWENKAIVKIKC